MYAAPNFTEVVMKNVSIEGIGRAAVACALLASVSACETSILEPVAVALRRLAGPTPRFTRPMTMGPL